MVTILEKQIVLERRLGNDSGVLPIPLISPVLDERGRVVVGIWEDDGVVHLCILDEGMVGNGCDLVGGRDEGLERTGFGPIDGFVEGEVLKWLEAASGNSSVSFRSRSG